MTHAIKGGSLERMLIRCVIANHFSLQASAISDTRNWVFQIHKALVYNNRGIGLITLYNQ